MHISLILHCYIIAMIQMCGAYIVIVKYTAIANVILELVTAYITDHTQLISVMMVDSSTINIVPATRPVNNN